MKKFAWISVMNDFVFVDLISTQRANRLPSIFHGDTTGSSRTEPTYLVNAHLSVQSSHEDIPQVLDVDTCRTKDGSKDVEVPCSFDPPGPQPLRWLERDSDHIRVERSTYSREVLTTLGWTDLDGGRDLTGCEFGRSRLWQVVPSSKMIQILLVEKGCTGHMDLPA
jgi:hypothetical protein